MPRKSSKLWVRHLGSRLLDFLSRFPGSGWMTLFPSTFQIQCNLIWIVSASAQSCRSAGEAIQRLIAPGCYFFGWDSGSTNPAIYDQLSVMSAGVLDEAPCAVRETPLIITERAGEQTAHPLVAFRHKQRRAVGYAEYRKKDKYLLTPFVWRLEPSRAPSARTRMPCRGSRPIIPGVDRYASSSPCIGDTMQNWM